MRPVETAGIEKGRAVMASLVSFVPLADPAGSYPLLALAVLLSAAGLPLPISALLVAVGVASAQVSGPLLLVLCLLCTVAAVAGDSLDYLLGRVGAPAFAARCPPWLVRLGERLGLGRRPIPAQWGDRLLVHAPGGRRRGAVLALVTSRFVPPLMPLATPINVVLGATRFAFVSFLVWDLLGEAVFVGGNVALGRLLSGPFATPGIGSLLLWSFVALLAIFPALFALARLRRHPSRPTHDEARADVEGQPRALASA